MRPPVLLALAMAFLVTGCSGGNPGPGAPEPAAQASPTPAAPAPAANATAPTLPAQGLSQSLALSLSEVYGATKLVLDGNCATLSGGGRVLGGNVTATWTAATPSAQSLAIVTGPIDAPLVGEAQPSPASWGLAPADVGGGLAVGVVLPGPGAAYQQPVTLQFDLQVTGDVQVDPALRACVA